MSDSPNTGKNTGRNACATTDLKDYFLKELPSPRQREVEAHIHNCQACREELDRLQLTGAALLSLRDEEIPQRIAFVSDKIFEPSPWRRAWNVFWGSPARLGFVSAAMLSVALLVSAVMRTAPAGHVANVPQVVPMVQTVSDAEIQSRIDSAVARAIAQVDARQTQKTAQLVAELESERKRLLLAAAEWDFSQKRVTTLRASAYEMPRLGNGEGK